MTNSWGSFQISDNYIYGVYPEAESNCYQKFRKLLFYPLNYRGLIFFATTKIVVIGEISK